ncbi:MAG: hypothetical protein ACUVQ0_03470 [Thermoproteota archaeon]
MNKVDFETVRMKEGKVEIIVPRLDYYRVFPNEYVPSKAPVFYNPLMKENRDLTVAVASIMRKKINHPLCFGDSMAGVGVRSIRIIREAGWGEAYVNDSNPRAFSLILKNIELNALEKSIHVSRTDANVFHTIHSYLRNRFDMLDIDPFGTPAMFLETGVQAVKHGGILSVTATDTANLFGVQRRAAKILYGVNIQKTGFMRELGVRVLLKAIAEAAAKHERGMEPVISITSRHYVKVLVRILKGRKHAFQTVSKIKFLKARMVKMFCEPIAVIAPGEECGENQISLGPIYVGETYSREWLKEIGLEKAEKPWLEENVFRIIEKLLSDDQSIVGSIDLVGLASSLHINPPSIKLVVQKLLDKGFSACRSSLDPNCIRTTAKLDDLISVIQSL